MFLHFKLKIQIQVEPQCSNLQLHEFFTTKPNRILVLLVFTKKLPLPLLLPLPLRSHQQGQHLQHHPPPVIRWNFSD
jgi:hypothetical protein